MNQSTLPLPRRSLSTNSPTRELEGLRQRHAAFVNTNADHRTKATIRASDRTVTKSRTHPIASSENNRAPLSATLSDSFPQALAGNKSSSSLSTTSSASFGVSSTTGPSGQHQSLVGVLMNSGDPTELALSMEQFRLCIELCFEHMRSRGTANRARHSVVC